MATQRLIRSIPFWALVVGSVVATAAGAYLLVTKLGAMDVGLTDGSATYSDLYVGQVWAIAAAVLGGIGLIGLALSLTIAALASLVPAAPVAVIEPPVWTEPTPEVVTDASEDTVVETAIAEETSPVEAVVAEESTVVDAPAHDER
jgi:hypothetical protein